MLPVLHALYAKSGLRYLLYSLHILFASDWKSMSVGGLTFIICAPSSAARWAAYAHTSKAVSPSRVRFPPRGYDHNTQARPTALASSASSEILPLIQTGRLNQDI